MNKFIINCRNISQIALDLIRYGVMLALGVLILGIFVCKYNQIFIGGYINHEVGISVVQSGISFFVQFIIGGIILDCVNYNKNKKIMKNKYIELLTTEDNWVIIM